jgi:hypothetical protein
VKNKVKELIEGGITMLLLPFVCLADCNFGDCDQCDKDAADIADSAFPLDELEGLIPGFGDFSRDDWVGLWHHIQIGAGSHDYDDRQGWFLEEPGPPGLFPDPLDVALMALFDLAGMSVNYDDSQGVHRYQISNSDDGLANTRLRGKSDWQFTTTAHIPFEPLDNLGFPIRVLFL